MNFTFTTEQMNTILRMLDQLPHGQVRQIIDFIMTEVNKQLAAPQGEQQKPADAEAATTE